MKKKLYNQRFSFWLLLGLFFIGIKYDANAHSTAGFVGVSPCGDKAIFFIISWHKGPSTKFALSPDGISGTPQGLYLDMNKDGFIVDDNGALTNGLVGNFNGILNGVSGQSPEFRLFKDTIDLSQRVFGNSNTALWQRYPNASTTSSGSANIKLDSIFNVWLVSKGYIGWSIIPVWNSNYEGGDIYCAATVEFLDGTFPEGTFKARTSTSDVTLEPNGAAVFNITFSKPAPPAGALCTDFVEVRLGANCQATITPEMISPNLDPALSICFPVTVKINDLNPTNGNIIDGVSPEGGWTYGLFVGDRLMCQGKIVAKDYTAPAVIAPSEVELWCDDITNVLNREASWKNATDKYFTGNLFKNAATLPDATLALTDNCGDVYQIKVTDRIDYTECGTSPSTTPTGTVYATVTRTFYVVDQRGSDTTVTQLIKFKRPVPSMFPVIGGLSAYNTINGQTVWSTNGFRNGTAVNYSNSTTTADMIVFNSCEAPTATGAALKEVLRGYLRSLYRVGYLLPGDGASSPNADTASIFDNFCNYSVDFTYKEYANCNNGKKFEIVTQIIDWCTGVTINDPVVLSFEDASAPVFSALSTNIGSSGTTPANVLGTTSGSPIRISVGTNECKGSLRLGTAWNMRDLSSLFNLSVSDNCSADKQKISLNYKFETGDYWNDRFFQSQGWTSTDYTIVSTANGPNVIGLPIGKHRVRIIGHDGCNNRDSVTVYFDVIDNVAPVMRCDDEINVTMTSNQSSNYYLLLNKSDLDLNRHMSARLYVADINEGSRDNCTLDSMYVRRKFNWTNCSDYMKTNMEYDAFSASGTSNGVVGVEDFEAVPGEAGMYFTPKGMQYVEYFCCDLGTGLVELWGSDTRHYNLSGGNWNFCWTKVTIEDKSDPVITAPNLNKTYNATAKNWVNCTEKEIIGTSSSITDGRIADVALSNALFGIPDIYGIECDGGVEYSVTKNLTCDTGTITRKWTVTKGSIVKSATQTIYVRANHNFSITVPGDQSATCSAKEGTEVLLDEAGCDLLAVSYSNVKYDAAPGDNFCYKIYRTATVINWCMVPNHYSCSGADPSSHAVIIPRNTGTAAVKYTFTLGSANTGRSQTALEASTAGSNVLVKGGAIAAAGESLVQGTTTASGFISPSTTNCFTKPGFAYKYTQIIKVTDDVKPTVASGTDWTPATADADKTAGINWDKTKNSFSISGSTCKANIKLSFAASDACATNDLELEKIELLDRGLDKLTPTGTSVAGTTTGTTNGLFTISASGVPVGQYDVRVTVRDDCGNVTVSRLAVDVEDNKAPAPVCVQNLTATLMPDGAGKCMVVVKAIDVFQDINRDWNAGECSPSVVASIAKLTNGVEGTKAATLTLTEADKGGVTARVYLTDAAGNADFCTVTIVVEDNFCGNGGASATVAGLIQTEGKTEVEGVQVNLSGESQKQMATGVNGRYVFQNLNNGTDYTVTPSLNKGFLNGVSTYDLILISKHILGNQPLNTPYKLIAADVNNSKSVTTLDMIQLRKLILNIDATFPSNSSWRFVDAAYTFPNAANPWEASFPEVKNVNDLTGALSANFVAVKVGDVNGNAIANSTQGSVRHLTSNLGIHVADMNMVAGNEYKVDFTAADLNGIEGFQFTLNLDKKGLALVDLVAGIAAEENFGIFAEEGVITASWNGEAKGGVLFSLVVRATSNTSLSEVLNLNSRYTAAEAYKGGEVVNVGLNFNASKASANYELYQNTPNPFAGETIIGFNLPAAGGATLTIQDVTGRTLKVINGQYARGYNQVSLKSTELSATGVLTYTLKTADYTMTRKMIVVE